MNIPKSQFAIASIILGLIREIEYLIQESTWQQPTSIILAKYAVNAVLSSLMFYLIFIATFYINIQLPSKRTKNKDEKVS